MKHAVKGKQLNRNIGTRRALFKNLMLSIFERGQIVTTEAKAKAVKSAIEKLITKAKKGTVHDRRMIDKVLNQRSAVNRLVDEIAPKVQRASGFTRITKLVNRRGDDARMVRLEIIDWKAQSVVNAPKAETKSAEAKKEDKVVAAAKPAVKAEESKVSKVKRPTTASTQVKHIPQKRIAGGGK
jgi:large subunit ribosomal protein L17